MKLTLAKPIEPYIVNQEWGTYHPEIYSQFGFTRHNGVDLQLNVKAEVRAEIPCEMYRTMWQPNGGGLTLSVMSLDEYTFDDGVTCFILIDYLHLKEFKKIPGGSDYRANTGDLLAIGDNTGFSTGPHCHVQYRRVYKQGTSFINIDKNEANGSFDPEPYRWQTSSEDHDTIEKQKSLVEVLKTYLDILKKLINK